VPYFRTRHRHCCLCPRLATALRLCASPRPPILPLPLSLFLPPSLRPCLAASPALLCLPCFFVDLTYPYFSSPAVPPLQ
ncbi:hypothetical protein ACLOJK_014978, partial [Asimina triloba]